MRATYLLYLLFSCICLNVTSQTVFHQDIFHGGVTAGGLSSGMGGTYTDTLFLHITAGSAIRNAFLFYYSAGHPTDSTILINNNLFNLNIPTFITSVNHNSQYFSPINLYYKNITSFVSTQTTDTFIITIPGATGDFINEGWYLPILYIEYEDLNMPLVSTNLWINDQDYVGHNSYFMSNMNPINTNHPVGLSIFDDRSCNIDKDGTVVTFNGNVIGTIGGSDLVNKHQACGGAKGHFYYENQILYGLDDDSPTNFMDSTDALADVSSFLNNNATSYNLTLEHVKFPFQNDAAVNNHLLFINTYTSPCDTFSTSLTPDTTICHGETLQLQATGGVSSGSNTGYEWTVISDSAAIDDLSCTDCPNPVFTGDKSQVYTVRIWNSDSCSVVKPVRIGVSQPQELNAKMFRSICSFSTGKIVLEDLPNNLVQLRAVNPNGDTLSPNSSNDFTGLSAGNHTVFYIDEFGCSNDTVIYVEPIISTVAQFNAYPKSGTAPIQINLSNQSQNATDYSWWLNGEYQGNAFSGFYTDTSGVYDIALIAWRNDSICADTTSFTIIVYDSLVAQLPNVFTPNNDGINDFFNVKVNLPVSYKLSILNRWGNVVFENEGGLAEGTHKLWDGTAENGDFVTDGTYFYTISFALDKQTVDCEVTECEVRKDGFVQVFGK